MKAIRFGLLNTSAAMVVLLWSVQAPAQAVTDTKLKASEPDALTVTAQKREQAIPVEKVVVDAPVDQPEHVAKHVDAGRNFVFRHAQDAAEQRTPLLSVPERSLEGSMLNESQPSPRA